MDRFFFDRAQEELEIEFNSHYDYWSEVAAGERECPAALAAEARDLAAEGWIEAQDDLEARGPQFRVIFADDEIPF